MAGNLKGMAGMTLPANRKAWAMVSDTKSNMRKTERELEIVRFQARFLTLMWALLPAASAGVILGAIMVDPGMLSLFVVIVMLYGGVGVASFTDDYGLYVKKRKLKWKLEDLREKHLEELVSSSGL